jgi:hypothetical protein
MRFRNTREQYDSAAHATHYFATAEVAEGHTVTREHIWMNHYGPVPGSHYTTYRCTCGAEYVSRDGRPTAAAAAELRHFNSAAELEAYQAEEAEARARILRSLGMAE